MTSRPASRRHPEERPPPTSGRLPARGPNRPQNVASGKGMREGWREEWKNESVVWPKKRTSAGSARPLWGGCVKFSGVYRGQPPGPLPPPPPRTAGGGPFRCPAEAAREGAAVRRFITWCQSNWWLKEVTSNLDEVGISTKEILRIFCRFWAKMATNDAVLKRLEQKGAEADQIIEYLKQQVALLKEKAVLQATLREEKKLRVENAKLKKEIEELKQELIQAEIQNGVKQIPVPVQSDTPVQASSAVSTSVIQSTSVSTTSYSIKEQSKGGGEEKKVKEKTDKKGEKKEKKPQSAAPSADSKPVDVSRLDLRIGRIVTVKKHPDADSLYVEEVDVGEAAPRTVISGLVNHVPLDQMQNRMVVLLCNLKPAKMRGILSQAMVMCASSPEKVEILAPPNGSVPGDRITFDAFPGEPDKELNPKKKIWEQIQPDLHTNAECVATYKGSPFEVKGKGVCRAQTMANSGIK